jgi:uncharacterized membrane protein
MFEFPPIPSWPGLHPLVIHFPIALLIVAPLFILLGLMIPSVRKSFLLAALILTVLGTIGAFIAVESGEAAADLADKTPEISAVLDRHQELAETTRNLFTFVTLFLAALIFLPRLLKKEIPVKILVGLHLLLLIVYIGGIGLLANTAHYGGRLVHEFSVHSVMTVSAPAEPGPEIAGDAKNREGIIFKEDILCSIPDHFSVDRRNLSASG